MGSGIVTGAQLAAAAKTFRALFHKTMAESESEVKAFVALLTTLVNSKGKIESHNWMGDVPMPEEWRGDRKLQRLGVYHYDLRNLKWANGIVVDGDDIEDDNLGIVRPRIMTMASKFTAHEKYLLTQAIMNGAVNDCYDEKKFFAGDHEEGKSGAQSNKFNLSLTATNFRTVRAAMMELKNDQGVNMGVKPSHLICCTSQEGPGEDILVAERDANGKTNTNRGKCKIITLAGTGSSTFWMLADLTQPVKPFMKQVRRKVLFRAQDQPNAEGVFMRDEYKFGADGRYVIGYGLWQYAALGKA